MHRQTHYHYLYSKFEQLNIKERDISLYDTYHILTRFSGGTYIPSFSTTSYTS